MDLIPGIKVPSSKHWQIKFIVYYRNYHGFED